MILICVLRIQYIVGNLEGGRRSRRTPRIFEMRDISAFGHSDDDIVPLACDEIVALERLSNSTGLNPDNRIILRVERGFPAKNHICYRKCFQEIRSTC